MWWTEIFGVPRKKDEHEIKQQSAWADEEKNALAEKSVRVIYNIHQMKITGKNKSDNHKIIIKKHFICDALIRS